MRHLSLLFPAALLLLAAGTGAQTMPYPQVDVAPVTSVHVNAAARPVWISADQARQIAGIYAMSNGWKLKVLPFSRSIDATIDRQKPIRLLAVSADKFVSGDGSVTMEFNRGALGNEMTMRYLPDPRLADVVELSSSVAQR